MRRSIVLLIVLLSLITLSSCVKKNLENDIPDNIEEVVENKKVEITEDIEEDKQEEIKPDESSDELNMVTHENNPLLTLACSGKLDEDYFGIGVSSREIVEVWGIPDQYDYIMGGLYFSYANKGIIYFTGGWIENNEIIHSEVQLMVFSQNNKKIFNIEIGMTFNEIIGTLGEPTYERNYTDGYSELLNDKWVINYSTGEYDVLFVAEGENAPIELIILSKKGFFS